MSGIVWCGTCRVLVRIRNLATHNSTGAHARPATPAPEPPPVHQLTRRQRRVLDAIGTSITERGFPPTLREIGAKVGLASPSSVRYQLSELERLGHLRRDPNRPRAITLTPADETIPA